jgi:DNA invertase Pin-like site-specific DNA recombinase
MNLGYARTSTVEQEAGLEAQQRNLKAAGVDKVFVEQVSSVAPRAQLELALDYLRDGDVLTVTKLDRLARSIGDLCAIIKRIEARGASLRILGMGLDTSTASGRLMLNVSAASRSSSERSCLNASVRALPRPRAKANTSVASRLRAPRAPILAGSPRRARLGSRSRLSLA